MRDSGEMRLPSELESGMEWVSACLLSLAQSANVQIEGYRWETDAAAPNEKMHYLVVIGCRKQKMLKLFSERELCNCQLDPNLQNELRARLLKILDFFRCAVR